MFGLFAVITLKVIIFVDKIDLSDSKRRDDFYRTKLRNFAPEAINRKE